MLGAHKGAPRFVLLGQPMADTVTGIGGSMGQAGFKLLFCKKNKSSHVSKSKGILQRVCFFFFLNEVNL